MLKSIVLITTGQPSLNPRIVKEADALHKAGYQVTVLYCYWISWATETDKKILQEAGWHHQLVAGQPAAGKISYNFTRLRLKISRAVNKLFDNRFLTAERAQARCYDELLAAAKKIKADWYIGHNLGALPVAVHAARFHHAKAGFDFEDHHRGETSAGEETIQRRIVFLENKYLPSLHYFSTASPMITADTKKNHPAFTGPAITLLNCFPLNQQPPFKEKKERDTTLRLFWFSQTIGIDRGLEALISALCILNDGAIQLTLAGRCDDAMLHYITTHAGKMLSNIHFAGLIQPEELPTFASQFDVGMAIELAVPENRNICLTNKIFTYLLAGNAIILSETSMQLAFNNEYKIGESFAVNDEKALAEKIKGYQNLEKLNKQKRNNYELANTQLNWEKESEKLLMLVR